MSNFDLNQAWQEVFGHEPQNPKEQSFYATMQKVVGAGQMQADTLMLMLQNGARDIGVATQQVQQPQMQGEMRVESEGEDGAGPPVTTSRSDDGPFPDGAHTVSQNVGGRAIVETFPMGTGYGYRIVSARPSARREMAEAMAMMMVQKVKR